MKLLCLPAFLLLSLSAHAATILSENFDAITPGLTLTTAGPFTDINGTNIDIVGPSNGFPLCAAPESGNCLDLGGSGGNDFGDIQLTTPLNLTPGTYLLSFDLIGSQRGITTVASVTFGSFTQTFTLDSDDVSSGIVVNQPVVIAGGNTQLEFKLISTSNGNIGPLLDNIVISTSPGATSGTPEPGSLALLGAGLCGAALLRRRIVR